MGPVQIRDRMLRQHRQIRQRLDEIEDLAHRVEGGDPESEAKLYRRAIELLDLLAERVRWEERHLLPAIRRLFGVERAAHVKEELCVQRELVRYQLDSLTLRHRPAALVAFGMRDFARLVRDDFAEEERLFS